MDNSQATLERNREKINAKEDRHEIERILNKHGWENNNYFQFESRDIPQIKIRIREDHLEFQDKYDQCFFFTDKLEEISSVLKFIRHMSGHGIQGRDIPNRTYKFMAQNMFRD
ncbi:hypothetical protein DLM76_20670 [Leptospira yasudae]|uniref:hypothetical protein n=1 Tax=Leptospira yasudae TaxID=2202201 RepID=UPI000E59BF8F|nr:hypothetical protein [Leptospira yasudae]RHX90278.1 hypothetical protein DLM76_20670 [Leptospira yasudae]